MSPQPSGRRPAPRPLHFEQSAHLVRRDRGDLLDPLDLHAALSPLEREAESAGLREPSLIGSADGSISDLLLTIPEGTVRSEAFASRYRELLAVMPPETRFVILTHESVQGEVESWPEAVARGDLLTLVTARDHINFTDWAEDPYVVVDSLDGASFIEPFSFLRFADSLIAEAVARHSRLRVSQAPLNFQGGNVLIGDDFFLIGGDYPRNSLRYVPEIIRPQSGETAEELVARVFQETFDARRRMIVVESAVPVPESSFVLGRDSQGVWVEELYAGNGPGTVQPIFHIDMFVTLGGRDEEGKYRIMVGDPGLAARELGISPWQRAMQDAFDSIAGQLDGFDDFTVRRNPLPLAYWHEDVGPEYFANRDQQIHQVLTDQGINSVPLFHWYFATANNALVEISEQRRQIWLPTYGHGAWSELAPIDQANEEIWRCRGFTAQPLGDFHPFAQLLGAVHCISKYLQRS